MRIRSIKPEFWRSDDITALCRDDRLLFIGLWSYVDDNGVGRDDWRRVRADLFGLEADQDEYGELVRDGLARLSRALLIARYEVNGKRYLHITNWTSHQKIDKPSKARYPRPDDDGALVIQGEWPTVDPILATLSRVSREGSAPGAVEQWSSGTGEQLEKTSSTGVDGESVNEPKAPSRAALIRAGFAEFWAAYPKKVGKVGAEQKFAIAVRRIGGEMPDAIAVLVAGAKRYTDDANRSAEFTANATTWLSNGRWDDQPAITAPPRARQTSEW